MCAYSGGVAQAKKKGTPDENGEYTLVLTAEIKGFGEVKGTKKIKL